MRKIKPSGASICGCIYLMLVTSFMITLGSVCIHNGKAIESLSYQETSYLNQVATDWSTVPFVDLKVTSNDFCDLGYETVFERFWYGQMQACDCLGIHSYNINTDNEMVL